MKSLYSKYIDIEPKIEELYVDPWLENNSNEYLELLYRDIFNRIKIRNLTTVTYPLLFLYKVSGKNIIVHHHWFEARSYKSSLRIIWKLFWLIMFKIMGGKIIWTIHNKYPHNKLFLNFNKVARISMAFISSDLHVHCNSAIGIMSKILKVPKEKFFVVKHPDYEVELYSKNEAIRKYKKNYKNEIDQSKKIFLIFGQIAEYKGIKELLNIFNNIEDDFILIIAGKIKHDNDIYFREVKRLLMNKNVVVLDSFIPPENVPILFNLADYVVFNYQDILTSGAVLLSLDYNKTTIAPKKGCINDIRNKNLITFDTEKELYLVLTNEIKKVNTVN